MNKISSIAISLLLALSTYAVPAYRGWQTKSQPDGTTIQLRQMGDEVYHYWADQAGNIVACDSLGYWRVVENQPSPATIQARRQASPMLQSRPKKAVGNINLAPRGLVILVNFKDLSFRSVNSQSAMDDLMNSENYTYNDATGSVRQYFSDQSNGQYSPQFDVVGPVTVPSNMSYYGANDKYGYDIHPADMVVEACSIANATHNVDFTKYDNDTDGYVDFVYIIYAGKGEADYGKEEGAEDAIWPHSWDVYSAKTIYPELQRIFDGKKLYQYACSGEIDGAGDRTGIGTIAHEFSHVIGLPDLYDTSTDGQNTVDDMTPDTWHIMDYGSYNNNGKTPPNYNIYDKYYLGWQSPINPGNKAQNLSLIAAGNSDCNAYQIAASNALLPANSTDTVYYIENRQQSGWDAHLPGHGLLIWRIVYSQSVWDNNAPNSTLGHLRYALLSATGKTTNIGTTADPFPGTKHKTEWRGLPAKPLLNITEKSGVISLSYIEVVDEAICSYEVLFENATVSSEIGKVEKGSTLTLTVKPAAGYLLDETMIEVEENNVARSFTYTNDTLTITNVQGELGIYIMPEEDPNYLPTANNAITNLDDLNHEVKKILHNGQLLIIRNGKTYTLLGQSK